MATVEGHVPLSRPPLLFGGPAQSSASKGSSSPSSASAPPTDDPEPAVHADHAARADALLTSRVTGGAALLLPAMLWMFARFATPAGAPAASRPLKPAEAAVAFVAEVIISIAMVLIENAADVAKASRRTSAARVALNVALLTTTALVLTVVLQWPRKHDGVLFPSPIAASPLACAAWACAWLLTPVQVCSINLAIYSGGSVVATWHAFVPPFEAANVLAALVIQQTLAGTAAATTLYPYPTGSPHCIGPFLFGTLFKLVRIAYAGFVMTPQNVQRLISRMRIALPLGGVDEEGLAELASFGAPRPSTRVVLPARHPRRGSHDSCGSSSAPGSAPSAASLDWSERAAQIVQGVRCDPAEGEPVDDDGYAEDVRAVRLRHGQSEVPIYGVPEEPPASLREWFARHLRDTGELAETWREHVRRRDGVGESSGPGLALVHRLPRPREAGRAD